MTMKPRLPFPDSYSKYWRINRSRNAAAELALALRAMRKVSGHIGPNVKPVFWKGMAEDEDRFIILDPAGIKDKFPIPHNTYDVLVGQVVREGFLAMEFTEWVRNRTLKTAEGIDERTEPFLENLVAASENYFVHSLTRDTIWGDYLSRYYFEIFLPERRDPSMPPTARSIFDIWQKKLFLNLTPEDPHPYYEDLLLILSRYPDRIAAIANLETMAARREGRAGLYRDMWAEIAPVILQWEPPQSNADAVNLKDEAGAKGNSDIEEDDPGEEGVDETEETETSRGLKPELAEDVSAMLDEKSPGRKSKAVAVEEPGARPMDTRVEKGVVLSDIQPDALQVRRMKKIFKKQELMIRQVQRKHVRRGLSEGKLDALRLYRVPLDGKVFKNKQNPGKDAFWQICIVADASASMSGKDDPGPGEKRLRRPWEIAEKSFVSLAAASRGHGNLLEIYAYRAERQICRLTRLYHGEKIYSVTPAGRTPSGQAILTAAERMSKTFKNNMVIHITDGASNCGVSLAVALDYCRKNGIDVFTLGCGCNRQTRDFLREYFPSGRLYFLKSIHQLADGLAHLLRQRILGSIR